MKISRYILEYPQKILTKNKSGLNSDLKATLRLLSILRNHDSQWQPDMYYSTYILQIAMKN